MLVVTSENFEQEVLNAQGPVLVDFFAEWCMPCKMFAPILEEAQEELGNKVKLLLVCLEYFFSLVVSLGNYIVYLGIYFCRNLLGIVLRA